MKRTGKCLLCGTIGHLTFEHVPPKSAFNDEPIFIRNHLHLTADENSTYYGKSILSNRGFGEYTLCKSCNNNTGDWYAKAYIDFAKQGIDIIRRFKSRPTFVTADYRIKPLNVLKQILTMFMSTDKSGVILQTQDDLVRFLLDKHSSNLPDRFRVFLYSSMSTQKRILGPCWATDEKFKTQHWAEINFKPYGFLLSIDSEPAHPSMLDITFFKRFSYGSETDLRLRIPYLHVPNSIIGMYE